MQFALHEYWFTKENFRCRRYLLCCFTNNINNVIKKTSRLINKWTLQSALQIVYTIFVSLLLTTPSCAIFDTTRIVPAHLFAMLVLYSSINIDQFNLDIFFWLVNSFVRLRTLSPYLPKVQRYNNLRQSPPPYFGYCVRLLRHRFPNHQY